MRAELVVRDRSVWDNGPRGWIKISTALDSSAWRGCVDQDKSEMQIGKHCRFTREGSDQKLRGTLNLVGAFV
jgi:hypothetical protein